MCMQWMAKAVMVPARAKPLVKGVVIPRAKPLVNGGSDAHSDKSDDRCYQARPDVKAKRAKYEARPKGKVKRAEYWARPEVRAKKAERLKQFMWLLVGWA